VENDSCNSATYVGQVECDPEGKLWAVLYCRDQVIEREQVRSLRKGRRRVTDMVLSAADTFPGGPRRTAPIPLNRIMVDQRAPAGRRRRSGVAHVA
jgi:hypothetical protein